MTNNYLDHRGGTCSESWMISWVRQRESPFILFVLMSIWMESQAFSLLDGTCRHVQSTKLFLSTSSLPDANKDSYWSWMDEAVLLYSAIDCTSLSTDKSLSKDIQQYRKREVMALLEDFVVNNSILQDSEATWPPSSSDDGGTPRSITTSSFSLSNLSLEQLLQLLDQTILEGYQVDFTEEALNAWTRQIEQIQQMIEYKQRDDSITNEQVSTRTTTTTITKKDTFDYDLRTRLLQLQTLVPPPKSWYTPTTGSEGTTPTMARSNSKNQPLTNIDSTSTSSKDLGKEHVIDNAPHDPDTLDTLPRGATVDTLISNVQASSSLESSDPSNDISSLRLLEEEKLLDVFERNQSIPLATRTSSGDISLLDGTPSTKTETQDGKDNDKNDVDDSTPTQVLSLQESSQNKGPNDNPAILSVAAMGALATTKIPYFATGVAMASVIKQSIDYAKTALRPNQFPSDGKASKSTTSTEALENGIAPDRQED